MGARSKAKRKRTRTGETTHNASSVINASSPSSSSASSLSGPLANALPTPSATSSFASTAATSASASLLPSSSLSRSEYAYYSSMAGENARASLSSLPSDGRYSNSDPGSSLALFEEGDMEACLRVVRACANDMSLFRSPAMARLRVALHPLVMAQAQGYNVTSSTGNASGSGGDFCASARSSSLVGDTGRKRPRGSGLGCGIGGLASAGSSGSTGGSMTSEVLRRQEEERLREMDAKHRNQTALRARRLEALEQLTAPDHEPDHYRLTDGGSAGTGEEEGGGGRVRKRSLSHVEGQSNVIADMAVVPAALPKPEIIRIPDGVAKMDAAELAAALKKTPKMLNFAASCYICKAPFQQLHPFYDQLCPLCAEVNFAKRDQRADMSGMVCLVTGARVKIGFRAALQLLRCGATVIATTRFPRDATRRFAAQDDFDKWSGCLRVYGADFRDMAGVERMCDSIKRNFSRLDVIVNNACQTIRRPAGYYKHLTGAEHAPLNLGPAADAVLSLDVEMTVTPAEQAFLKGPLVSSASSSESVSAPSSASASASASNSLSNDYEQTTVTVEDLDHDSGVPVALPRVAEKRTRRESQETGQFGQALVAPVSGGGNSAGRPLSSVDLSQLALLPEDADIDPAFLPAGVLDVNSQQVDMRTQNSWTMRLHEVSTPELAEVFAINTIAPTVINARLKELMARSGEPGAWRFIVNVSAMEGKFYRYKSDKHPHTNMAKAALNMMTRTSAGDYRKDDIFMTCVDTGWINDEKPLHKAKAHEQKHNFQTPLDEVDAASRVLDPVIQPLVDRAAGKSVEPPYGVFLKDYAKCEW